MKYSFLRAFLLSTVFTAASAYADTDLSYIFTSRPKNTFSASISFRSSGSKVHFGNVGSVPRFLVKGINLEYDDGIVGGDALIARPEESFTTTKFNADHTRYQTFITKADGTTAQVGDFLAFVASQTRYWSYNDASQVADGLVSFHERTAVTSGAGLDATSNGGAGFDLELNHEFGPLGKLGAWGIAIGFGTSDINGKIAGTVKTGIKLRTDRFSLLGKPAPTNPDPSAPPLPYTAPVYTSFFDSTGATLLDPKGLETTTPLASSFTDSNTVVDPAGGTVFGRYQLKAAYYLIRLGPMFRYQPSRHFSFSISAGPAAAVIGSTFSSDETVMTPTLFNATNNTVFRQQKFKTGAYAEANAEYWLTFRTGFFAGAVYEHLGKYSQSNSTAETASVDIGSGFSFRVGIITRF